MLRAPVRALVALLALALALVAPAARAVAPPPRPALPDWDARGERAGLVAGKTSVQAAALRALQAELPPGGELVLVAGPEPGTLHHLFRRAGFLSGPRAGSVEEIARGFIARHRDLLGLDAEGVRELRLVKAITDPGTGARHAAFEQSAAGLTVFHGEVRVHLDASGRIVSVAGNTARVAARPSQAAWLPAEDALRHAAAFAGLSLAPGDGLRVVSVDPRGVARFGRGPFESEPWAWRAWFPRAGSLRPAWIVTADVPGGSWYQLAVDGETGEPLHRFDLVEHAATEGLVFRQDPDAGPQVTVPFVDGEAERDPASPSGWSSLGVTQGNNCDVKDDVANDDETTAGRRAAGAPGATTSFAFPFTDDPAADLDASITNLFWLNNWLHDRLARMGFDEASGNFQAVNAGAGGRGGDAVLVDAQDGSGRNNANFGTPPDGFPPRMQMYVWTFTDPWRDSGFDGSVVTHELFHGVSNRLVGLASNGAGCLGGPQGGAMGEAWSDFFPCSFWNTPVVGAYVVGDAVRGIRRAPYDAYPFGYGDLCNQGGFEVHRDGEIWAATLWDLRELFIARHGRQRGQCLIERLVLDGMKLSPCLPTYLDMRDAILLAARLRGEDGDACLLWQGFAARGMGLAAVSRPDCTSPADASFDAPPECAACDALAPPDGFTIDADDGDNRVVARYTPSPGATEHVLLRSAGACPGDCAEAPFVEVARGSGTASELIAEDEPGDPMSAGAPFSFRVVALQGACTASTGCLTTLVTGRCTLPPVRGAGAALGVVALTRPAQAECALMVEWEPAQASCGPPWALVYNVYRSEDPAFVPGPEHLVASVAAPATSFLDATAPAAEATYVVRAEDLTAGGPGPHGGNEEGNDARLSLQAVGPVAGTATFRDDCEGGELPGYRRTGTFPINDWAVVSDANTGGGFAWHASDVEGGNADKNLHLPLMSLGAAPRLRFRHAFRFEESFDGAVIEISTDGGRSWRDLVDDIVAGGYETSRGSGMSFTVGDMIHPPNTNRLWTGENASGFPAMDAVDVDLAPYAGLRDVQLRLRVLVDPAAAEPEGWYVDDIVVEDVLAFGACSSACVSPPQPALRAASACASAAAPAFAVLDASGSLQGGAPLRDPLGIVLTHDGPGSFDGRRWAEGPMATLAFPPGTPPGDYVVTVTARDEDGCAASLDAVVSLRDETLVPSPVGDTLRVTKEAGGLRLDWGATDASGYNVHLAPFGADLAPGLAAVPPWMHSVPTTAWLGGPAGEGGGSLFLSVHSASDCGRSIP